MKFDKAYWLHLARATADYVGLTAILTTALLQIDPAIINHVAWFQIVYIALSIILFGALKGAASHITDGNLRAAILTVLADIQRNLPTDARPTISTPAIPKALDLPSLPRPPREDG